MLLRLLVAIYNAPAVTRRNIQCSCSYSLQYTMREILWSHILDLQVCGFTSLLAHVSERIAQMKDKKQDSLTELLIEKNSSLIQTAVPRMLE